MNVIERAIAFLSPITERDLALAFESGAAPAVNEGLQIIDRSANTARFYQQEQAIAREASMYGETPTPRGHMPEGTLVDLPDQEFDRLMSAESPPNPGEVSMNARPRPVTNVVIANDARAIAQEFSAGQGLMISGRATDRAFANMWQQFSSMPIPQRVQLITGIIGSGLLIIMVGTALYAAYKTSDRKSHIVDYNPQTRTWRVREN